VLPAGWWSGYWVLQAALTTCRVKRWQWKLERIMIKQGFFFYLVKISDRHPKNINSVISLLALMWVKMKEDIWQKQLGLNKLHS